MTAKQLIELLSDLSPDTTVLIPGNDDSLNGITMLKEISVHPNLVRGTSNTSIFPYSGEYLIAEENSDNYYYTNEELKKAVVII